MREQPTGEKQPGLEKWGSAGMTLPEFLPRDFGPMIVTSNFERLPDFQSLPHASNTFVAVWPRAVISLLKTWVSAHTVNDVLVSRECRFVWR